MIWKRHRQEAGGGTRGAPGPRAVRPLDDGLLLCDPEPGGANRGGLVARIGAPPLIALASALGLVALLSCALFVPGFVRPADAGTTSTTVSSPGAPPAGKPSISPEQDLPIEPAGGRLLASLTWGEGAGQVGLAQPGEGLARGPEALAVAPDGRVAILDSVNSRLVLLTTDGSPSGSVSVALTTPRFLAVDDDSLYVLDADTDRRFVRFDWKGAVLEETGVPDTDDVVTGLFVTDGGPCLEVAHDTTFLLQAGNTADGSMASADGKQGRKPAVAGLHALAGRPLDRDISKAAKITFDPASGMKLKRFTVDRKTLKVSQTQGVVPKFNTGPAIEHLVSLDGDGQGGLVVGARLLRSKTDPANAPSLVVGRMRADAGNGGNPTVGDVLTLADCSFAYVGQPYVVAPDGRVFQPMADKQGYTITVYSLPSADHSLKEVQP